jgi:hypothetical protein
MVRALLGEFGINIPQGVRQALEMARNIVDGEAPAVPKEAAKIAGRLSQQALDTHAQLREIDLDLLAWQRARRGADFGNGRSWCEKGGLWDEAAGITRITKGRL